ncbi:actin-related protein 8-like [Trachinotus anak]|uniref:actin-related protein 8-like n=1 Tax=Trachinotus anak TaxID=443729 RepID=UPI0039F23897
MVDQAIWSEKMSNGVRRTPVSAEQARAYNCQVRPAVLDTSSRVKWTNTAHHPPYLVGEEALYVNPSDCYSIHWPVVRGQLSVHPNPWRLTDCCPG